MRLQFIPRTQRPPGANLFSKEHLIQRYVGATTFFHLRQSIMDNILLHHPGNDPTTSDDYDLFADVAELYFS
jgi:hypothetical protein